MKDYKTVIYSIIGVILVLVALLVSPNDVFKKSKLGVNVFEKVTPYDKDSVNQSLPAALRWIEPSFGK